MARFDELLTKLNEKEIWQTWCWEDDLYSTELWEEYFEGNYEEVVSDLDVDKRRWYEISTTVLRIAGRSPGIPGGRYLGIRAVTNIYSEEMDFEDCVHKYSFFEMEEIQTISYKEK